MALLPVILGPGSANSMCQLGDPVTWSWSTSSCGSTFCGCWRRIREIFCSWFLGFRDPLTNLHFQLEVQNWWFHCKIVNRKELTLARLPQSDLNLKAVLIVPHPLLGQRISVTGWVSQGILMHPVTFIRWSLVIRTEMLRKSLVTQWPKWPSCCNSMAACHFPCCAELLEPALPKPGRERENMCSILKIFKAT